ncbi:hypothetical protein ACFYXH_12225 [Streptomyces sp. NPDC002730]|uniref:hypothetical protein n=1 Tax=Streptomyces sp. NPDC002730 TaxID=3364662 RepID=UPI003686D436
MSSHSPTPGSPIYDQMVRERGDVLAEARTIAALAHQYADQALRQSVPVQQDPVERR